MLAIVGVAVVMMPLISSDPYILHIGIAILIWSMLALGIRIVLISGHLNIAQASFMGMGAYASGVLAMKLGWSFWVCLPAAGVISAVLRSWSDCHLEDQRGILRDHNAWIVGGMPKDLDDVGQSFLEGPADFWAFLLPIRSGWEVLRLRLIRKLIFSIWHLLFLF